MSGGNRNTDKLSIECHIIFPTEQENQQMYSTGIYDTSFSRSMLFHFLN